MKVEIYSDIACPWCYIGEKRFQRALAAFPQADSVDVVYRSYQLDPNTPAEPVPHNEYMQRRFGKPVNDMLAQVTETARGEGIEMNWDEAIAVNTLTAHRLLRLAEQEYGAEVQRALVEKLFEAHFTDGGNVADHDLLTEHAAAVGMDEVRVRDYLASNEGLEETREDLEAARARGVQAVPTFVFEGQWAVQGAQSASAFLQVLEEVTERTAGATASANGEADEAAENCADGSCTV